MACSCKKNVNNKYLTEEEQLENKPRKLNGIEKVGKIIGQFFFGLLISAIIISMLIPFCLYMIVCICIGKDMSVRIPNFTKWLKK